MNKRLTGENNHPGDADLIALLQQTQQICFITGVVDAGNEHQFTAHDPIRDPFVFCHVVPAYRSMPECHPP